MYLTWYVYIYSGGEGKICAWHLCFIWIMNTDYIMWFILEEAVQYKFSLGNKRY